MAIAVARPGSDADEAVATAAQAAHDSAVRRDVAHIVRFLQDVLGQSLTALIADVRNVKAVGKWAKGKRVPHPQAEQRLRHAYQVTELLTRVESPATIRAWFLGLNPLLDDTPPALMLGKDPVAVLKAARAFAANG
ncbi:MAG: XRE family transcriptional regulator [Chloroflexota bacterium]